MYRELGIIDWGSFLIPVTAEERFRSIQDDK